MRKNELTQIINDIPITPENKEKVEEIKKAIENNDLTIALEKLDELSKMSRGKKVKIKTLAS